MSYEKRVKVVLHGYLKKLYPKELFLSGHNVSEIINGMCKMTKAFNPAPNKPRHLISVVGFHTKESLLEPIASDLEEIHLTPAFHGGKKGGFFQIVVGVVLIAAAFWTGGATLGVLGQLGIAGSSLGLLGSIGLSMLLGGLLAMLSPQPKISNNGSEADPEASKYLGATENTVKIGTRIPFIYGRVKHGGHYISFDVDAKDVAV